MLDNTSNQPTKFRTKNWVEIKDGARGMDNTNSQIKFLISMLKPSLCHYGDVYIIVSETITIAGAGADAEAIAADRNNKQAILKNSAPFTDCVTEINKTQLDNAKDLNVVMLMYNLTEYSENYSKTSESLWQYWKDVPNDPIESESFKFKSKF